MDLKPQFTKVDDATVQITQPSIVSTVSTAAVLAQLAEKRDHVVQLTAARDSYDPLIQAAQADADDLQTRLEAAGVKLEAPAPAAVGEVPA